VIMGAEGAGKSSLLHIIGGQKLSSGAEISGKVYFNDKSIDDGREKAWQKCAFVEALDSHYRDLTVNEVVRYALELRNHEEDMSSGVFLQTLEQTFTLLQLSDLKNTKAKYLTPGEMRRLSIAEEIVVGPLLVLLDEPITGLDAREASIIITQTLREIVNQDRTVVCTMHQPSAAVFEVFDTLVLLSKGRLIYIGPADKAVDYFISSPTLGISNTNFSNPAEFLFGVSGGFIVNGQGGQISTETLEKHYFDSSAFGYYNGMETFRSNDKTEQNEDLSLSGAGGGGQQQEESKWRCASFDGAAPDSFVRRSVNYSHAQENPSYWDLLFLQYYVPLVSFFVDLGHIDFIANARRSSVLLRRASRVLFQRPRMMFFSTLTHVATAFVMVYIVVDDQENNAAVVTPTSAFGGFLLMMMNIQFAFFLFNNQKVFLREHSRGLYSTFLRWLVEPLPLLLLRSCQGFVFALIIHQGLGLQGGEVGMYFMLMTWFMCLACTMIIETICYTLKDIRDVYGAIIVTALTLFLFSGLFFKPATLPEWMGPWLPSISIIRWYAQGIINNEFDDNLNVSRLYWCLLRVLL
jgi:ABC-type multidrug transport system ATPase subunit